MLAVTGRSIIRNQQPCNTPIFPVQKPNSDKWQLVHDLRAVNIAVMAENPMVPDPHTVLSNYLISNITLSLTFEFLV